MTATLEICRDGAWAPVGGGSVTPSVPTPWVRPAEWLALPVLTVGQQKFAGLLAVFPGDSNFVSLNFAGAYTVEWGDGTAPQNVAANTQANHTYTYASVAGTDCTRGYRQAVVTITPQAGQNLTKVDLYVKPTQVINGAGSPWLDIGIVGASVITLTIGGSSTIKPVMLEQFTYVGASSIVGNTPAFYNSFSLESVVGTEWLSTCNNMTSMFNSCYSLATVPLFNTAAVTTMSSMFTSCYSLATVPLFNTAAVTTMSSMFNSCYSLATVPLFNTAAVTTMSSMFQNCSSLATVPLFNTVLVTTMNSMFQSCSSLATVPLFNTAAVTTMNSMFYGCSSLATVPLFNTALVTIMNSMFYTCSSLATVPLFNTVLVTNISNMFTGCTSLQVGAMSDTKTTIAYASCKLSAADLNAIYINLASLNSSLNMLSYNTASMETNITDWGVLTNCTVNQGNSIVTGGHGTVSLIVNDLSSMGSVSGVGLTARVSVTAGSEYTFMAHVAGGGAASRQCRLRIGWYDAGGALLSTTSGIEETTGASYVLKKIVMTAIAPVGAVTASPVLSSTYNAVGGNVCYWDKFGFFPGTVTEWSFNNPGQTITVTGNWGVATDDPSIATAKGWTVTG